MNIAPNYNIQKTQTCVLKKGKNVSNPLKIKRKDTFEKQNNVSFKGIEGVFKTCPALFPKVEVLPGVNDNFVTEITKQISKFPNVWLRKFKKENYDIILSPTLSEAYKSKNIFDPVVEFFEKENPKCTLGVTYDDYTSKNKNFFAFCDKPPYSKTYMNCITNHELSHGVVNISKLDKDPKTFEMLKKDIDEMIGKRKFDKMTPSERLMTSHYFFNKNAYMPVDEITADVYAWNLGEGFYGSGLALDVVNPDLMKNLFPNLAEHLKTI